MGIPVTTEFLSSPRSSLQLLVSKNRIKATTEKRKGMKLTFTQKIFTRTLKQAYKGILFRNKKEIIKLRITGAFSTGYF